MDERLDDCLDQALCSAGEPSPSVVSRIAEEITTSATPVRPMPAIWTQALAITVAVLAVGMVGAMILGPGGYHKLSLVELAVICSALGLLTSVTAWAAVGEMGPGHLRLVSPVWITAGASALLLSVFALIFRHPGWFRFLQQGVICLRAGLVSAFFAAILMKLILRRGYAVEPLSAGLLIGSAAGFAGVTVLELHCTDFQTQHVLIWHTAVIPSSAVLGFGVAWVMSRARRRL